MKIATQSFGSIDIAEKQCIHFPSGIIGFEEDTAYALLDSGREHFYVLQSLTEVNHSFILVNPYMVRPDYTLEVADEDLAEIQCVNPEDLLVFSIVTIPEDTKKISCNLLGPVLINRQDRLGRQSISLGEWQTKHFILEEITQSAGVS